MITLHFDLQPQYRYELFHINFTKMRIVEYKYKMLNINPTYTGSIFVCGPLHHYIQLFRSFGAVGLCRSDMLLILNMVWPWFSCRTVCVCPQFPYRGNDTIFWIFPIVPCHAFCMWHWPIGKYFDFSFIWGHHHLHIVGLWISDQLNTSQLATPCWDTAI